MATTKRTIKVAPERLNLKKIWNISDWPAMSVTPQTLMVMGTTIPAGGCIEVPAERLVNAHKTEVDKKAGLLCVGDPPVEYLAWRNKFPRARLNRNVTRVHGKDKAKLEPATPTPAPKEPAAEKAVEPRKSRRRGGK